MICLWLSVASAGVADVMASAEAFRSQRGATHAPPISAQVYSRAERGPVSGVAFVSGVSAGKGWGVAVMDAPVAQVWMAINSESSFPARFGNLSLSEVISGVPAANGHRLLQVLPLPVVSDRWWMVDTWQNGPLYTASRGLVWEQYWTDATDAAELAGHDVGGAIPVGWTEGAWLLVPVSPTRTVAEYYAWTDPGGSLPAGPASRFATGSIKSLLGSIERLAQQLQGADRSGFVRPDQRPL